MVFDYFVYIYTFVKWRQSLWPLISASGGRCFCGYLMNLKFETLCGKAYTLRCWEVGGVAVPCVFSASVSCWAISRRRHIDDWRSPEEEDSFFALPTGNTQHVLGPANTSVKHVLYYRAFKNKTIKKNPSFPIADLITTNKTIIVKQLYRSSVRPPKYSTHFWTSKNGNLGPTKTTPPVVIRFL